MVNFYDMQDVYVDLTMELGPDTPAFPGYLSLPSSNDPR
ncbi:hypothetical protein TUZN_2226 [Thermoproteus uzoniensis 768-20]|uniref:Uncharacterized protein n=1 Tax=Thermoproteus uzoniensis (strain 768-20) TaxID=999630 RepID=F2L665_THEU7|nr:hypothetical protein TUZN_2226 [Thermoproteus uzoniensis 768-20]